MAAAQRSRGSLGVTAVMPRARDLRDNTKEELMQMVEAAKATMMNVKAQKYRKDQVGVL